MTLKSRQQDVRAHHELRAIPFTREIEVQQCHKHSVLEEAIEGVVSTVKRRMSAGVIGPAGTGKSILMRTVDDLLPDARYRVHYVKVTDLSKRDFCRQLAIAVGCEPAGYYGALVTRVQQRCQSLMDQDSLRPVLLIDEAHDMRPDVLATLRVLTNFEMDSRLVVSFVLAGQTPLRQMLRRADMEAVARRIAYYATLRNLSREETRDYIDHRLDIAGASEPLLDQGAYDAVYAVAGGNPRATNRVVLASLEEAMRRDEKVVGADIVTAARRRVLP